MTSKINNQLYLPWSDAEDRAENFTNGMYTDPAGMLKLSAKQKQHFKEWVRASELAAECSMTKNVCSKNIRQTVVGDCSFVCSLAISADYERRFNIPLITNRLFPRRNGMPAFNPCGKYVVKLHFNGVWRKVVIDDYLPVGPGRQLLCSHTNTEGELWVSLIEKAYLKVMGGYDFPGSNSGVDMHSLSGWIPERIGTNAFKDADWTRLKNGLNEGNALITIATGDLTPDEESRTGLVAAHAYAVLAMKEVNGVRLLYIKNPWNKGRWKGDYSPHDTRHWTRSLQHSMKYDADKARGFDDGEFWMELRSARRFFEVFHLNWNPSMLKHTYVTHRRWEQTAGPVRDRFNMGENPQYTMEITSREKSAVWVLLSRHITDLQDFADNKEFITCHVFKGGKRIHHPDNAIVLGTKINSPHYLCRFDHPGGSARYSLVISQHEKSNSLTFTVKVFSSAAFRIAPMPNPYAAIAEQRFDGKWTTQTAAGSTNKPNKHKLNPKWSITVGSTDRSDSAAAKTQVRIQLFAPKEFAVGITVDRPAQPVIHSGAYRPGYCVLETNEMVAGVPYTITVSTFDEGCVGPYYFKVAANKRFVVKPMPS
eukprot:m.626660 g.626660  ORF g.626660 m.626660 type:complete len:594 (-) comp22553_c0_seq28:140-1921(-)